MALEREDVFTPAMRFEICKSGSPKPVRHGVQLQGWSDHFIDKRTCNDSE